MRLEDELVERNECSYAHHHPVQWHEQCPLDEMVLTTFQTPYEMNVRMEEVPEDETERAHIENRHREQYVIDICQDRAKEQVDRQQDPHERIDEQHCCLPANHQLQ